MLEQPSSIGGAARLAVNALRILPRAVAIGLAASTMAFGPALGQDKVLKVVMHSDLKAFDPVWTGA